MSFSIEMMSDLIRAASSISSDVCESIDSSLGMLLLLSASSRQNWDFSLFMRLMKRFLTEFSVRPTSRLAMSDHFLPMSMMLFRRVRSSSLVQGPLLNLRLGREKNKYRLSDGSRWLFHLSLHCFPNLNTFEPDSLFISFEISFHLFDPFSLLFQIKSS